MTWYHSKRIFIWSVICIFITLVATVVQEYTSVSTRLNKMDSIIRTALDVAVEDSMQSEEAFSDDLNNWLISKAAYSNETGGIRTANGTSQGVNQKIEDVLNAGGRASDYLAHSTIDVFARQNDSNASGQTGGSFIAINPYYLAISNAMKGNDNKALVTSTEINAYKNISILNTPDSTAGVFAFLYGEPSWGSYLKWSELTVDDISTLTDATRNASNVVKRDSVGMANTGTANALLGTGTLDDFSAFYDSIGATVRTRNYVRVKLSDTDSSVQVGEYPTLLNMGLQFNTRTQGENNGTDGSNVDIKGNTMSGEQIASNVNMMNSLKAGKHKDVYGIDHKSYYFLTPQSLGVTYVPISVVKPVFTAELDSLMRYDLIASGNGDNMNQATGCIDTSYYRNGGNTPEKHISNGELITNNGDFEADLNSVKVKVDYYCVNVYTNRNSVGDVMTVALGGYIPNSSTTHPSFSEAGNLAADKLLNTDTAMKVIADEDENSEDDSAKEERLGKRLIAKVTVKVKCHVPYKNTLLQWMCYEQHKLTPAGQNEHYGIKMWDSSNNKVVSSKSDDIWYQTSKYVCVSR